MSVITIVGMTPNRMTHLCRYLDSAGEEGIAQNTLRTLLGIRAARLDDSASESDAAREAPTAVAEVLRASRELGLMEDVPANGPPTHVRLTSTLRGASSDDLRAYIENRLTDPEQAPAAGQPRLPAAIAWVLEQDPARPFSIASTADVIQRLEQQFEAPAPELDLGNTARLGNLRFWLEYLGLAWTFRVTDSSVLPDPTAALSRHLDAVVPVGERLPIGDVLQRLGERCPVLEGGVAREQIVKQLKPAVRRPVGVISRATSLALKRLEERGVLRLEALADASGLHLLSTWPDATRVSHLTLLRPEAAS